MPQPFDPPCFHRLSNIPRPVQITKSLITQFSPAPSYCAPLFLNTPLNNVFSDLKVIEQTSHPYKAKKYNFGFVYPTLNILNFSG